MIIKGTLAPPINNEIYHIHPLSKRLLTEEKAYEVALSLLFRLYLVRRPHSTELGADFRVGKTRDDSVGADRNDDVSRSSGVYEWRKGGA